ncbi:hypothetical protein [Burkholderia cenocepacia]|uniref:hypothetical protein n=1 Tax=Burkholderia cenocepacia TaxID=95486 RepID=UPI00196B395F|nr:hypothetical protein [Burkholderia cenocepacia]MBN3504578.1 hypothetical protein [Burkholderia cenocepacia]MCO1395897.1 hypothetical protein [Burkholderia cenocepacia]MCO1408470.1 hypothetical protein [Burkholderia cenocepacia]UQN92537.1 hypothetical protein L0Z06_17720 [Burkholderia cenocepacia]UQN99684.1 hypothetical protein L0Z39_19510 [Burkholderia cenocepacia]
MSISEIFRVVRSDVDEAALPSVPALKKPKILSIGGCVTEVLAGRLNRLAKVTHLWRISVPCLMSKKVDGRTYFESHDHQLSERINFELTKQALHKLKTGGYEFLIFDPTSDFTNDYFEKDGCIISDMEAGTLAPDWKWPEGFINDGWTRISPRSHQYLEIYFHYLGELIKLSEDIGVPLVVLKRRACANKIISDGITALGDPDAIEINWWVDLLWKKIESLTGRLNVLDLNSRFSITSFDAPWGEAKFHPIEEFYDYAAYKLMYLMRLSDDLISEVIFDVYRERASRRVAVHAERDALLLVRDELTVERDALARERDALTHERDTLARERDALTHERDTLARERDALRGSVDNLEAEYTSLLRHESEKTRAASEQHAKEIAAIAADRDTTLAAYSGQYEALQNDCVAMSRERDELRRSCDSLVEERDFIVAHETERARAVVEVHAQEIAALSEARDAALAVSVSGARELSELQALYKDLSHQHDALCIQQRRLFDELRLDGGPMALRDVLPLARAWRPVLKRIGKAKQLCRRLIVADRKKDEAPQ